LVTRGEQPANQAESLALFKKHFVDEGQVTEEIGQLITDALRAEPQSDCEAAFDGTANSVAALIAAVKNLYHSLGPSLRSIAEPTGTAPPQAAAESAEPPDGQRDFRGVACPLNYVKVKLTLESMDVGQVLEVLLDEQGAKNVPDSAKNDGHEVLGVVADGGHWNVRLRKGNS
jgi:sulfite reductase (ferredoxin)